MTLRVIAGIHWQAARLYFKRSVSVIPGRVCSSLSTARFWGAMAASLKVRFAKEVFVRSLKNLRYGSLELVCPGETLMFGDIHSDSMRRSPSATGVLCARHVGGDIGIGESYMDGQWTSPDVCAVLRLGIRNLTLIENRIASFRDDSIEEHVDASAACEHRQRSRANISYHYDLGNDFYRLFLDCSMAYSCGYYLEPSTRLRKRSFGSSIEWRKLCIAPGERTLRSAQDGAASRYTPPETTAATLRRRQSAHPIQVCE
jgi:cyclopropane-fatty-acyl-phospholipid synthase